ncbi:MAG: 3-phosphoshikimate 1-carboxyvinyltransferase [Oscillospiraceae bacterium]|nr:3-phosphoshikimate 1-carboxyvinyltransferase [Oscillospiraceae bacterium]
MDIKITPSILKGHVDIPSSKSYSHRAVIAASLAQGTSVISGVSSSADIDVTCGCMERLGASITRDVSVYTVKGIASPAEAASLDCGESGSTLRFVIPVAAALGTKSTFSGRGKLPSRPITPYIRELSQKGITFDKQSGLPITAEGRLTSGIFSLEGDISSQFITGLMFALPLLDGESCIRLTSPLQSKPYADMTMDILRSFGISIEEGTVDGLDVYRIRGGQRYAPHDYTVEGDWSQAAFFYTANAMGCSIDIGNLKEDTVQGDSIIRDMVKDTNGFTADVADIPDLVPILAVFASFCEGTSHIVNAERLRIKESDRLVSTSEMINALGGHAEVDGDSMTIHHTDRFKGGEVDAHNDHRIVMAAAIASVWSTAPVVIHGAEAVSKSYPGFFEDLRSLGGDIQQI